jgi:TRAP transporter TAXI family solute receptor
VTTAITLIGGLSTMAAPPYILTLCAASVGGTWSLLGAGVDAAMRKEFPGSAVTIQTSGGGVANAKSLVDKRCDIGIMHAPEVVVALKGEPPFSAPVSNLRVVARIENWSPMHFIMTKEFADKYKIKTMEDIARAKAPLRIVLNRRGNLSNAVAESMLKDSGVDVSQLEKWGGKLLFGASGEQTNLMQDRRADAAMNVLYPRFSSIMEIAQSVPSVLINVSPEVIEKTMKKWNVDKFTITGGTYNFDPQDVTTVTMGGHLMTIAETPDSVVTDILKAITTQIESLREMHPEMKRLTPQLMPSAAGLPYHPAAQRFFKERYNIVTN